MQHGATVTSGAAVLTMAANMDAPMVTANMDAAARRADAIPIENKAIENKAAALRSRPLRSRPLRAPQQLAADIAMSCPASMYGIIGLSLFSAELSLFSAELSLFSAEHGGATHVISGHFCMRCCDHHYYKYSFVRLERMEEEKEEESKSRPLPYLEGLRERRGLMRMEAIRQSEECDSVAMQLKDIAAMQAQTAQTMAWMAQKMRDTDNTVQFLIRENALLRSRQAERQQLIRVLQTQQQSGVSSQLSGLAQQQTAIINALSAFSLSFHQPPPAVDDDPLLPVLE